MNLSKSSISLLAALSAFASSASAINIVIDYSLDTNNFFDTEVKKSALQAAADRYSRIIDSSLAAVGPNDSTNVWRIGFTHPGTGLGYSLSTAADLGSDPLSDTPADSYGYAGLAADTWILYAGGRSLTSAAQGGTGTGLNFTSVLNDVNGPMHRGFDDNTPTNTVGDLPRWGGAISFSTDRDWHFDLATEADDGFLDFYSIALHEIGHALGLNAVTWNQFPDDDNGNYLGANALAAYNADNNASLTSLDLVDAANGHFKDNEYDSKIFALGNPNIVGTVGENDLQDLLMEPIANFVGDQQRFELTNVDVAALTDIGWSIIPEPSQMFLVMACFAYGLTHRRRIA